MNGCIKASYQALQLIAKQTLPLQKTNISVSIRKCLSTLAGENDKYNGVHVDLSALPLATTEQQFEKILKDSISAWRAEQKSAVWLQIPVFHSRLITSAAAAGFRYHHAEGLTCRMNLWMQEEMDDATPMFATHQVGVAGVVLNEDARQVIVVQDQGRQMDIVDMCGDSNLPVEGLFFVSL